MEAAELDVALEELETRLERLRALYEQYFMGIEKIEPAIARKDVDRRIYVLRREKIRNTAKRFKLQTIIQRYNTFQQYWQRICREIENGTYKRHLLRAQKNGELLTIAARKRLGKQAATNDATAAPSEPPAPGADAERGPSERPAAASSHPPSAAPVAAPPAPQPSVKVPEPAAPFASAALPRPAGSPPLPPRRPPLPSRPGDLGLVAPPAALGQPSQPQPSATAAGPAKPPPAPTRAPLPAAAAAPAPPPQQPAAAPPAAAKPESLSLDMDFMGDWDPAARPQPAKPRIGGGAERGAPPRVQPLPRPPEASARPASVPPATVAAPPRPTSNRPPTAPLVPRAPAGPRVPPSPRIPPTSSATAAAAAPKPVAAPPAAAATKPVAAEKTASSGAGVDDARLRDLHSKLQKAKEQTKEANVSYEGLAKSIRATEAKLREQHKNRKIEFDVVIKDGKAVVKPIVR